MRTCSFLLFLAALVGLWSGCESTGNELPPPKATADLALRPEERDVLATLQVGNALRVILPPPQEPGYAWEIVANPGRVLRQITGLRPVPGAPDHLAVTFQATRPLRSRILFMAIRPGQAESTAAEQYSITVGVNMSGPPPGS